MMDEKVLPKPEIGQRWRWLDGKESTLLRIGPDGYASLSDGRVMSITKTGEVEYPESWQYLGPAATQEKRKVYPCGLWKTTCWICWEQVGKHQTADFSTSPIDSMGRIVDKNWDGESWCTAHLPADCEVVDELRPIHSTEQIDTICAGLPNAAAVAKAVIFGEATHPPPSHHPCGGCGGPVEKDHCICDECFHGTWEPKGLYKRADGSWFTTCRTCQFQPPTIEAAKAHRCGEPVAVTGGTIYYSFGPLECVDSTDRRAANRATVSLATQNPDPRVLGFGQRKGVWWERYRRALCDLLESANARKEPVRIGPEHIATCVSEALK